MKNFILILSLSAFVPLLSSCLGPSETDRWTTLPGQNPVTVLIRTSGTLKYQKSKESVEAKVVCPNWPWYEMTVTWPEDARRIGQADMEIMEEKWLGGGMLVVRVFSNGRTVYDGSICEKHHVPMARANVGNFEVGSSPDRYLAASKRAFPNAGMDYYLSGFGCDSGLTERVWRCSSCHEAFERWMKLHGISD